MTFSPSRPCKHPMCGALVPSGEGTYCVAHKRVARVVVAARDRHRGSAADRGYDADWQRYRISDFLPKWPLCLGVLIPDMTRWTRAGAEEFHRLREIQRAAGRFASYAPDVIAWLVDNPIYRLELWDVTKPATVVDHIIPHKGDFDLMWSAWNHQPVTPRAHNRKTAVERPEFHTAPATPDA